MVCMFGSDSFGYGVVNFAIEGLKWDCPFAIEGLKWIFNWCDIPIQNFEMVSEFVGFAATWGYCPKKCQLLLVIFYGFLWCI